MSQRSARHPSTASTTPQQGVRTLQTITAVIAGLALCCSLAVGAIAVGVHKQQIETNTTSIAKVELHHREDLTELKLHIDHQFEQLRQDIRAMNQAKGGN